IVKSDETWRISPQPSDDVAAWTTADFDDSQWPTAIKLASYGDAPWGAFAQPVAYGPYATGIEGEVRVIYVPESRPIEVRSLPSQTCLTAFVFDPVSGEQIDLGDITPNEHGTWTATKPPFESDAE